MRSHAQNRLKYAHDICPLPWSDLPVIRHTLKYAQGHYRPEQITTHDDGYSVMTINNRLISWTRTASALEPKPIPQASLINIYEWLPKYEPKSSSGWLRLGSNYTCAYVSLNRDYSKSWNTQTRRHLKAFLQTRVIVRTGTPAEVRQLYKLSQVPKNIQRSFISTLDNYLTLDAGNISILVAEYEQQPIACLVSSDYPELKISEYFIGAFDPAHKEEHAMIGLFNAWHMQKLTAGYTWLSLGHIEPRVAFGPWNGNGYSIFKLRFGISRVWLPASRWRIKFGRNRR